MALTAKVLTNVLQATPGTKQEKSRWLSKRVGGASLPQKNLSSVVSGLVHAAGKDDASRLILELALHNAPDQLGTFLRQTAGGELDGRRMPGGSALSRALFGAHRRPTAAGRELLSWMRGDDTAPVPRIGKESEAALSPERGAPLPVRRVEPSAPVTMLSSLSGMSFTEQRVGRHVQAARGWSEARLHEYLVGRWSEINFGYDQPLRFVASEYSLDKKNRADIVARLGVLWVVLELKVVDAGAKDISQLLNYMGLLGQKKGVPPGDVYGCLIAPRFSDRHTAGALALEAPRRLRLLQFDTT